MIDNDLASLSLDELRDFMIEIGEKKYRSDQIFSWIHHEMITDFDEMSNIPNKLIDMIKNNYPLKGMSVVKMQESEKDGTIKVLYSTYDNKLVESVIMRRSYGNTVCVSSQIGCNMGCSFCASTIGGKERNLTPYEMLSQVYMAQKIIKNRVSNVVVMGMGEPLENFDNLIKFVLILSDQHSLNISQRNITVSTCGLVDKIYKLADRRLAITLAISLHACNDEKRRQIMPIARKYSLDELIKACEYYYDKTGRRISLEYCMIKGFNISRDDWISLSKIAKKLKAHINLISVNENKENNYNSPSNIEINNFIKNLELLETNVTLRRSLGDDIDGACGQLRHRYKNK